MDEYRYGQWAGNERGVPEDKTKCIKAIYAGGWYSHQCTRKRGYGEQGLFCKQHSKEPVRHNLKGEIIR